MSVKINKFDLSKIKKSDLAFLLKDKYKINSDIPSTSLEHINSYNNNIISDVEKLALGVPLDYVIGYKDFINVKIDLSKKTLIPRIETEYWVFETIKKIQNKVLSIKVEILDIFCGSGCIGISLLKEIKNSYCTFSDISQKALDQTKINLKLNKIEKNRYKLIKSNVWKNINSKFDYIFANPPYIGKHDNIQSSLVHEPYNALFAKHEGMYFIEMFLDKAFDHLNDNGTIFMEFGKGQELKIRNILENNHQKNFIFHKDQFGITRWVEMKEGA